MILQRSFLLWALLLGLAAFSCSKDEDDDGAVESDLTISNGWSVTKVESNLDDEEIINAFLEANDETTSGVPDATFRALLLGIAQGFETVDDCEKDDVYIFLDSGKIRYVAGANACPDDDLSSEEIFDNNANWILSGDELTISDDDPGDDDDPQFTTFKVKTLTDQLLILQAQAPITEEDFGIDVDGKELTVVVTFKAN